MSPLALVITCTSLGAILGFVLTCMFMIGRKPILAYGRLEIQSDNKTAKGARVLLDGLDVSNVCQAICLEMKVGQVTRAELVIIPSEVAVYTDAVLAADVVRYRGDAIDSEGEGALRKVARGGMVGPDGHRFPFIPAKEAAEITRSALEGMGKDMGRMPHQDGTEAAQTQAQSGVAQRGAESARLP